MSLTIVPMLRNQYAIKNFRIYTGQHLTRPPKTARFFDSSESNIYIKDMQVVFNEAFDRPVFLAKDTIFSEDFEFEKECYLNGQQSYTQAELLARKMFDLNRTVYHMYHHMSTKIDPGSMPSRINKIPNFALTLSSSYWGGNRHGRGTFNTNFPNNRRGTMVSAEYAAINLVWAGLNVMTIKPTVITE